MSKERLNPEERIGQILDDAQALINFCETSLSKPSRAWYACLVASAILTVDLEIPLDVFLEGFEHAFEDAEKARVGGQSYDH